MTAEPEKPVEEYPEMIAVLTMITIPEPALLQILHDVAAGADPDTTYMEYFAAGIISEIECECDDDCDGHCDCAWCALPECDCDECLKEEQEARESEEDER
jgi:hypothetical protein